MSISYIAPGALDLQALREAVAAFKDLPGSTPIKIQFLAGPAGEIVPGPELAENGPVVHVVEIKAVA